MSLPWFEVISEIMGWSYFIAWSLSFYPQVILNYRRKSVSGLTLDFVLVGLWSFLCYFTFNVAFFTSEHIRQEYRYRNGGKDSLVRINDLAFATHACFLTLIQALQIVQYRATITKPITRFGLIFIIISAGIAGIIACVCASNGRWLDLINYLSVVKLCATVLKYIPQVVLNYRRRSTVGWSMGNVMLDFTGGVLSVAQLFWDAIFRNNIEGISGNPVKFGLGLVCILFDIVFMVQHYVYIKRSKSEEHLEEEADLISSDEEEEAVLVGKSIDRLLHQ